MNVKIRKATIEDASMLADLSSQLGYPTSPMQSKERLISLLKSKDHGVFVANFQDGSILGWIHVYRSLQLESDPFTEIGGFIVAEKNRGSGVGKMLLAASEKWALDNGLQKLRIRSNKIRKESHQVFKHLGFSKTKDQVVFDKQLKP